MVISRDVSHAVRVADQPVVFGVLILHVDTGLVRGLSMGENLRGALAQAIEHALTKPAGTLAPGRPQRILTGTGLGDAVRPSWAGGRGSPSSRRSMRSSPVPRPEDIFDSYIGHMAARRQPVDPPSPADWKVLSDQVQTDAEATPWRRWADDVDLVIDVVLNGERRRVKAVVMGNAGIQPGLAIFRGEVVESRTIRRTPIMAQGDTHSTPAQRPVTVGWIKPDRYRRPR